MIVTTTLNLILLLFFSSPSDITSNCNLLVDKKVNQITGKTTFVSKEGLDFQEVSAMDLDLKIIKQNKEFTFLFKSNNEKLCFRSKTALVFKTIDGRTLNLFSSQRDNCDGELNLVLGGIFGRDKVIDIFKSRGIKQLDIVDKLGNTYAYKLSEANQTKFKSVIGCLGSR